MSKTIVTTSHKPEPESVQKALTAAEETGALYVERNRLSLDQLRERYQAENVLVVKREQLTIYTPLGEYFFHPSMSVPRIKALRQGKQDQMVSAMSLVSGDQVLDCTLGLGSDAIVAAFTVGEEGSVTGVEASLELAYLVKCGLQEYEAGSKGLKETMSRVRVVTGDCGEFLQSLADNSFDIVYFDPMFRFPRKRSSSMEPVRGLVNSEPLNPGLIKEALRVARKRVVMKENSFSREFERLGFESIAGGKYSPVAYGVLDKAEEKHDKA